MAAKGYSDDSIVILEGLEAVRRRPAMYIGSTDSRGLHHLVWEIVDNSIDEALAGHGREIEIEIKNDNSIKIKDNGRGMPCGKHASGKNTLEVIFTILHAGGKFGSEGGYKVSGGLHGVGASVVNALSSWLEVESATNGFIHTLRFENGNPVGGVKVGAPTKKTGTTVTFKPNPKIFSTTLFNYDLIRDRARQSAFLIKNLKMIIIDNRSKRKEEYLYENGIKEYVAFLNEKKGVINDVIYFEGSNNDVEVEIAMQFTNTEYSDNILSFANNVRTPEGGTHEVGYKSGLTKSVNDFARKYGLLKEKELNLDGADIRDGLTGVISIRIPEKLLEFEGQTKSKLGTSAAKQIVENILYEKFTYYMEEHKDFAETIIKNAIRNYKAREAARKARDEAREGRKTNKKEVNLSGKLAPAQSKDKDKNELFIVEGDSAGGSAKLGRDRRYQAILPLRGKVLNTEKAKEDSIIKNEEIATLIHTIGADYGGAFDLKKTNYDKVIIMTDADTDGAHIQVLLITFFFSYMRPLIEAGKLYIAMPPLYKITLKESKKETINYAWSEAELAGITRKISNYTIQRYKGLGEMNADQLWETTMDPQKRTLIQVGLEDISDAERRINVLMGDDVAPRREWIESHVAFTLEDDFIISKEEIV